MTVLPRRAAVLVFLAFALAYFLSALIRAITATLSPVLMQEFGLDSWVSRYWVVWPSRWLTVCGGFLLRACCVAWA
jgi:hypothetical protein